MSFLAILIALFAETLLPQALLRRVKDMNSRFTAELEVDLASLGAPRFTFLQWFIPVAIWVLGVYFLHDVMWQMGWFPALAFNIIVLLYGLRFWHLSEVFTTMALFLSQGDFFRARETFLDWVAYYNHTNPQVRTQRELIWQAVDHGVDRALRQFFTLLFYYIILPGPTGVALYIGVFWSVQREQQRWQIEDLMTEHLSLQAHYEQNRLHAIFSPRYVLYILEWVPARLLALTWIVMGFADDYSTLWREARQHSPLSNRAPLAAVGLAAVGLKGSGVEPYVEKNDAEEVTETTDDAGWNELLALSAFRNLVFRSAVAWLAIAAILSMIRIPVPLN
ncbi:MAG: hypothetical protein QE278_03560 [Limnobacter sp.]|nr:hypothetical protein [Limnobacter sp.]